jgi:hypothetical protein
MAELLRLDNLKPVYHGQTGVRMLRELAQESDLLLCIGRKSVHHVCQNHGIAGMALRLA